MWEAKEPGCTTIDKQQKKGACLSVFLDTVDATACVHTTVTRLTTGRRKRHILVAFARNKAPPNLVVLIVG